MQLTTRQIRIILLAASGLSNKQIARELRISARTVDDHFLGIRHRIGAADRAELVARTYAAGILVGWPPRWCGGHDLSAEREEAAWDQKAGQERVAARCEPLAATGELIGYACAATPDRSLQRLLDALAAVGCRRVLADDNPVQGLERPALRSLLDEAHPGDTLVVWSLACVSQSLADLFSLVDRLHCHGLGFRSLREILDTTSAGGWMIFHVFAALADFLEDLNDVCATNTTATKGRAG